MATDIRNVKVKVGYYNGSYMWITYEYGDNDRECNLTFTATQFYEQAKCLLKFANDYLGAHYDLNYPIPYIALKNGKDHFISDISPYYRAYIKEYWGNRFHWGAERGFCGVGLGDWTKEELGLFADAVNTYLTNRDADHIKFEEIFFKKDDYSVWFVGLTPYKIFKVIYPNEDITEEQMKWAERTGKWNWRKRNGIENARAIYEYYKGKYNDLKHCNNLIDAVGGQLLLDL